MLALTSTIATSSSLNHTEKHNIVTQYLSTNDTALKTYLKPFEFCHNISVFTYQLYLLGKNALHLIKRSPETVNDLAHVAQLAITCATGTNTSPLLTTINTYKNNPLIKIITLLVRFQPIIATMKKSSFCSNFQPNSIKIVPQSGITKPLTITAVSVMALLARILYGTPITKLLQLSHTRLTHMLGSTRATASVDIMKHIESMDLIKLYWYTHFLKLTAFYGFQTGIALWKHLTIRYESDNTINTLSTKYIKSYDGLFS